MRHLRGLYLILFPFVLHSCNSERRIPALSNQARIEHDLEQITRTEKPRNYRNIKSLNIVADYILSELSKNCDTVYYQKFYVNGLEYKNVVGVIGPNSKEKIVIGAHYDVAGDQEGADDNASGIAGLLELSRLISIGPLGCQIEFVAYTLEEPPYFRTDQMGSFIHAKSLHDNQVKLKGMICLEMIGYFNDTKGSQDYPLGFLRLFYGNTGNYITVVQKWGNGRFGRQVKRNMKDQHLINTKSFRAPAGLPGIDLSDHLNYWKFGYSAVMVTNTAFYRNNNYHEPTDQLKTLDIVRMGRVIDEVYLTLRGLN